MNCCFQMEGNIMTVKEFKNTTMCKNAKHVKYIDVNGVDISSKPEIILNLLQVIGTSNNSDGTIEVDVFYTE